MSNILKKIIIKIFINIIYYILVLIRILSDDSKWHIKFLKKLLEIFIKFAKIITDLLKQLNQA